MSNLKAGIDDWVTKHPYLDEVAQLQKIMVEATEEGSGREQPAPANINWQQMKEEIEKGLPVLKIVQINDDTIKTAADLLVYLTGRLAASSLPSKIVHLAQQVQTTFNARPVLAKQIIAETIAGDSNGDFTGLEEVDGGFVLFLAWSALTSALEPLKILVGRQLKDHQWRRGYCPVCGQLPVMAQLVQTARGRERLLICGCCRMKWKYKRIGCPYCGSEEQEKLKIIGVDEEPDLRIDTCEKCRGYLKTYTAEENEGVVLADWSTLHLDLIGKKQGFKRIGYQMYAL